MTRTSKYLFALFTFSTASAFADSSIQTSIHHHYQAPRALGMGDAFVAIADDYSGLFYNPASLARREEGEINMSIDLAGSPTFQSFSKEIDQASKIVDPTAKNIAYTDVLKNYYGKQFSVRTGLLGAVWVRPHWGVALIPADLTMRMVIHQGAAPTIDMKAYVDTSLAYGYGADIKGVDGRLSWGVTTKFVNRGFASKQILPFDLVSDPKIFKTEDLQEGYTVDADLGFLYTPFLANDGFWSVFRLGKPTFGIVVRNVGEVGFGQSLKQLNKIRTEAPEKMYRVLDVGTKFEYPSMGIFSGRGAMDFRDIGHPNYSLRKGFHLGFEFDWRVASWWRGSYRVGVNQGYPTLGFSALFTLFNLDLVTYGEDVGSFSEPKENRVYMLKLNLNI